ncbi:MAG: tRNA (adenosine(37)-N6)-threonylcarbamoyltransferase complex ATPase subunit type 1 TsaE, partial [Actinobacteria bacterium]
MAVARISTESDTATRACGQALAPLLDAGDVLLLSGDLGAGKTQLTKGIGVGLGVAEPVTSPTFNILLVHEGRIPLYHFDLYRLDRSD